MVTNDFVIADFCLTTAIAHYSHRRGCVSGKPSLCRGGRRPRARLMIDQAFISASSWNARISTPAEDKVTVKRRLPAPAGNEFWSVRPRNMARWRHGWR
ncbi:hypothetical protein ACNKHK_17610 [Shigella flexneri]